MRPLYPTTHIHGAIRGGSRIFIGEGLQVLGGALLAIEGAPLPLTLAIHYKENYEMSVSLQQHRFARSENKRQPHPQSRRLRGDYGMESRDITQYRLIARMRTFLRSLACSSRTHKISDDRPVSVTSSRRPSTPHENPPFPGLMGPFVGVFL